ncbi:MAG: cryptochrome/photolyase family protein [Pseudomonadota bacterium]
MGSFTPIDAFVPSEALASLAATDGRPSRASGGSIVIVFGDQLTQENPAIMRARPGLDLIVLIEDEANGQEGPRLRLQRGRAFELFAEALRRRRHRVETVSAIEAGDALSLHTALRRFAARGEFRGFATAEPSGRAIRLSLEALVERYRKPLSILRDPRFLCSRWDFADIMAEADGPLGFYKAMRRREAILMDGDAPVGGRWRIIDGEAAPRDAAAHVREPEFGSPAPTAAQAEIELERFALVDLPRLGACEFLDPLRPHPFPCPQLEALLDLGLLTPGGVAVRIERAFRDGHAPLHAAEHAIYRLIGLREYRRGLARIGDLFAADDVFACKTAA